MGQKGLMFLEGDGSKCLNQNFQLHRSLGGTFNFLTPLIRNSKLLKVGTPYVLKICSMFINMLYKRIAC